ncbi:MAG TPA: hypothetical protein VFK41_00940 [Nocardioidaceae bacterium]|nr:hypothetical protein [Nocardioidaceae bacterium]
MIEDHDEDPNGSAGAAARTGRSLRAMTWVLSGLAVIALIAIVTEAAWLRPRHDEVTQERQDRTEVLAAATRWATVANTYTPETFDDWMGDVSALLTTKFRGEFESQTEALRPTIQQIKLTSTGTVLKTGVSSIDDDSAVVLVVADADTTSTMRNSERHFRWQVDLVKVDDEWLVDDFAAVQDPALGAQP